MIANTFSVMSAWCFVAFLIWDCAAVDGLVNEQSVVQYATTIGYYPTEMMAANTTYGETALPFDPFTAEENKCSLEQQKEYIPESSCGNNSHICMDICHICHHFYGAPSMTCLSNLFTHTCLSTFESAMASLNSTEWCIWDKVRGFYSNLSNCTENMSDCLLIPWPNFLVEETFVDIHVRFFKDCSSEELSDPPPVIVFALVITPICLIPVMVILVVLKTKNGDGSS